MKPNSIGRSGGPRENEIFAREPGREANSPSCGVTRRDLADAPCARSLSLTMTHVEGGMMVHSGLWERQRGARGVFPACD